MKFEEAAASSSSSSFASSATPPSERTLASPPPPEPSSPPPRASSSPPPPQRQATAGGGRRGQCGQLPLGQRQPAQARPATAHRETEASVPVGRRAARAPSPSTAQVLRDSWPPGPSRHFAASSRVACGLRSRHHYDWPLESGLAHVKTTRVHLVKHTGVGQP